MKKKNAKKLIDFLHESPTPFHAIANTRKNLFKNGFEELKFSTSWKLEKGKGYFVAQNESSLIAFNIGENCEECNFRIVGAHTDSPGLKLKPNPELLTEGYLKLNTEVYGGPILTTWFDRPLALAGRVLIKTDDIFTPETRLINICKPVAVLPNLAIHMNREVNKGVEINNQKDMLPLLKTVKKQFEKDNYVLNLIANELKVKERDILDFELYLYEFEKGSIIGIDEEFISSSRIDDLQGVYAGTEAVLDADHNSKTISVLVCFDNEEVGSTSKQGADSQLLSHVLERVAISLKGNASREDFLKSLSKSFILSIDGAHAVHPNKPEKSDPVNKPVLNGGPVIKISANQKYTSDAESISVYKGIAERAGIPFQMFVNHSNEKGGSTIGPINSTHLEMRSVDIGLPMFAMHSIREMCGVDDHTHLIKILKTFYETT